MLSRVKSHLRAHWTAAARWSDSPACSQMDHFHREETSAWFGSFAMSMKLERESVAVPDLNSMDRRIIQVGVAPTQAGITAALRRAFEAAACEPSDRDFAELLRKLN
jgi:hypothetical protein